MANNCTQGQAMKVYDNYEISPCRRYEEPDTPGKFYFEVCEPEEADVWTLYGHINGEGVEAIGDFSTREDAEATFQRITGIPFTGSYRADAHLRVMHAGPKLLRALEAIKTWWMSTPAFEEGTDEMPSEIFDAMCSAIAEATEGKPLEPASPIVIEVRGGVVQHVLNVPPGCRYEIRDYDDIEADEESEGRQA